MECRVNNPKCDGYGVIQASNFEVEYCFCTEVRKAEERYRLSGAEEKFCLFPNQLKKDPNVKDMKNKKVIKSLELLREWNGSLNDDIKSDNHKILYGDMGNGKTQIACTYILLAALQNKRSYFLDMRDFRGYVKDYKTMEELKGKVKEADVLVIDDIGVEAVSNDFYENDSMNLLDWIVRHHRGVLLITTNKDPQPVELLKVYPKGKRMIDSLFKNGVEVYLLNEGNIRR